MAISLGDAVLKMGLDKSEFDQSMTDAQRHVKSSAEKMQQGLRIAGAAFIAVGAAGLKLVDSARKMNAQLSQVAIGLGTTTEEMRDLALETTNVTFPLESVTATFSLLARAGVESNEQMMQSATAFDTLADATGSSAEAIADLLLPAFKLFGEEIPTTAAELDRFTFLTKNTTVDLQDFGTMLTRMAPEMETLKLSMDDAVLTLAALSEKGIEGSAATLALRTAITRAAREGKTLNEVMGITPETIARLTVEMEGATGITQEYADAANTQFGLMDKIRQEFSELTLRVGSYLTPLEPVLAATTALGPAMLLLSTSQGMAAAAAVAHGAAFVILHPLQTIVLAKTKLMTVAQWALNAAMIANPAVIVVAAFAALGVAVVQIIRHWDDLTMATRQMWEVIQIGVGNAGRAVVGFLESVANTAIRWINGLINTASSAFNWLIDQSNKFLRTEFEHFEAFSIPPLDLSEWEDSFTDLADTSRDSLGALRSSYAGTAIDISQHTQTVIDKMQELKAELEEPPAIPPLENLPVITMFNEITTAIKEATDWGKMYNDVIQKGMSLGQQAARPVSQADIAGLDADALLRAFMPGGRFAATQIGAGVEIPFSFISMLATALNQSIDWVMRRFQGATITGMAHGGVISEPTLLTNMRTMRPFAIAGEAGPEAVIPLGAGGGFRTANISIMLDSEVIARVIGAPLVEEIRLQTGVGI